MLETMTRNWWLVVLRGVLAIIFGVLAFIWPGSVLAALVLLFGAYALVDGIFALGAGIVGHGDGTFRLALVLIGITGIAAGILTFFWPGLTALTLLYLIAGWAIITGVAQIVGAIRLRQVIDNEWTLIIGGVITVAFGALAIAFPGTGALSIIWLIGTYAILFGVLLVALGFRLRGMTTARTA
jgi:uncharacterized membrane protein HdeD (DUF308 family)